MLICIPSKGRARNQETLKWIPKAWLEKCIVVCPYGEINEYLNADLGVAIAETPQEIKGIAATRKYLIENTKDKYLMFMDDDLKFAKRVSGDSVKLLPCTEDDMVMMFKMVEEKLNAGYAHVAISSRSGNNNMEYPWEYNIRYWDTYAYNLDIINKEVILGRVQVMEDFDVNLQLIEKGYASAVLTMFTKDDKGSNADGGCSTYRTHELQKINAYKLQELHPEFVKVEEKKSNNWKGFDTRFDVRVNWKKAYASSFKCDNKLF